MKDSCVDCLRFAVVTLLWFAATAPNSYGQFGPVGQGAANLPPNIFQAAPGQVQPGPVFGGQGGPVQIPQVPQVGIPGQFPQNGNPGFATPGSGFSMGTGFNNGSTPFNNGANGQATIVTGLGALEVGTAQGNVLNQQATSIYLNNHKQAVSTYYDVRRIHDNARAEHERVPSTREQRELAAKVGVPPRLTKEEFDSATGKITWPDVLAGESFADYRTQLEKLFSERLNLRGGRGSDNCQAIRTVTGQMQSRLQSISASLSPQEYTVGHKFLASLAHEGATTPHPGVALGQ